MKINSTKKGFTLIELLIVITIIGILAVNLLPIIFNAPVKARDAARRAALSNLVGALETFNTDKGGYPTTAGCIEDVTYNNNITLAGYFSGGSAPKDPGAKGVPGCNQPGDSGYYYCPITGGHQNYMLVAISEQKDLATATGAWLAGVQCPYNAGNNGDLAPGNNPGGDNLYTVIQ